MWDILRTYMLGMLDPESCLFRPPGILPKNPLIPLILIQNLVIGSITDSVGGYLKTGLQRHLPELRRGRLSES